MECGVKMPCVVLFSRPTVDDEIPHSVTLKKNQTTTMLEWRSK